VLQCTALCCSMLQHEVRVVSFSASPVCCSVLYRIMYIEYCSTLYYAAVCYSMLQDEVHEDASSASIACCRVLLCVAVR